MVKVYIGSFGRWVREDIIPSSEEGEEDVNEDPNQKTLVGAIHPVIQEAQPSAGSVSLGPSLYHWGDNGEYATWFKEYPESLCDVIMISHVEGLMDGRGSSREESYALLEPCEILTEEEWLQGGLTP